MGQRPTPGKRGVQTRRISSRQGVGLLTASVLWMTACFSAIHGADPATDSLLSLMPDRVNAVVLIDVQKLLGTPLAKSEDWAAKQQELASEFSFPLNARIALRGLELYPEGRAVTEAYNVILLGRSADMKQIATAEGGEVELLAGKPVVLAPGKGYFVDFGKQRLGVLSPAFRQQAGSWIRESGSAEKSPLESYLMETLKASEAQLVMALDLQDVFGTARVKDWLSNSQALVDKPKAVDAYAATLTSIQGIRLEVSVSDQSQAVLSVDFQKPLGASQGETLKAVLLEVLTQQGYGFKEFQEAPVAVSGKSLQLQTALQTDTLMEIVQLGLVPHTQGTGESSASLGDPQAPKPVVNPQVAERKAQEATFAYYKTVAKLIDSSARRVQEEPENFPRLANNYDTTARRISELPIKDVDQEIVKFGASSASTARALAASYRGASVNVDALNKSITWEVNTNPYQSLYEQNYSHGYFWSGTTYDPNAWQVRSNKEQVRQEQVQAVTAEAPKRQQLTLMLQDDRQKARQYLNEKFNADPEAK